MLQLEDCLFVVSGRDLDANAVMGNLSCRSRLFPAIQGFFACSLGLVARNLSMLLLLTVQSAAIHRPQNQEPFTHVRVLSRLNPQLNLGRES